MNHPRAIAAFVSLFAALVCCGREDVDLAAPDAGCVGDAACAPAPDASVCRENGVECGAPDDCCSRRCEAGLCLASGACAAPETPCATRSGCCSGRCEPFGEGSGLVCLNYCVANGGACDKAQRCCSLACNGGVCGGDAACKIVGDGCSTDAECCSNKCDQNRCQNDPSATCRPSGEGCEDDAGIPCCSKVCSALTKRCDLGPGACREPGTPCVQDGDCCRGQCLESRGAFVCTAPCLANGAACNSGGDCCAGGCRGAPATCGGDGDQ